MKYLNAIKWSGINAKLSTVKPHEVSVVRACKYSQRSGPTADLA